jgi:uncharacterized phage-associated protein
MAYDARTIANEFLKIADNAGRKLTNMQLQKLVYIAHGYTLAILHDPLIDQSVEAWRYGPVIEALYKTLRQYGAGQVTDPIPTPFKEQVPEDARAIISTVYEAYSRFSGPQLSTMTHKAGTPWAQVYDPKAFYNQDIPNPLIERYYVDLLNDRRGITPA